MVFGGYSQGAAVVNVLTATDRPVCSNSDDVPAHGLYGEAGIVHQAAEFAINRLKNAHDSTGRCKLNQSVTNDPHNRDE
jgi:hypothetical protein